MESAIHGDRCVRRVARDHSVSGRRCMVPCNRHDVITLDWIRHYERKDVEIIVRKWIRHSIPGKWAEPKKKTFACFGIANFAELQYGS